MPKTKKFIDKKKSVSFQLVHRSQQDPLVVDEKAPQRVLLPVVEKETEAQRKARLEKQQKYGIFYDDEFNYLEHLKDPAENHVTWPEHIEDELVNKQQEKSKLQLPSSVFASEVEEEVGMLNKAAPQSGLQLDLDPDLVAAMDEDFDYSDPENQLEDNFLELANGVVSGDEDFQSEEDDEVCSLQGSYDSMEEVETKSRFTNYSMSSSVIRRNDQLTLLDSRFEKMYEGYDENEIGALDCEEIEGHIPESSNLLLQYAEEFQKSKETEQLDKDLLANRLQRQMEEESDDDEKFVTMVVPQKEKWDCESILSTYSNIYNHPKLIVEPPKTKIKIDKKTGIPKNVFDANKLTAKALNRLDLETEEESFPSGGKSVGGQSMISQLSVLSIRNKDETPEERRERKKLLKEYRREQRIEKKLNKMAFKEEALRQVKIDINNKNMKGSKIL